MSLFGINNSTADPELAAGGGIHNCCPLVDRDATTGLYDLPPDERLYRLSNSAIQT